MTHFKGFLRQFVLRRANLYIFYEKTKIRLIYIKFDTMKAPRGQNKQNYR